LVKEKERGRIVFNEENDLLGNKDFSIECGKIPLDVTRQKCYPLSRKGFTEYYTKILTKNGGKGLASDLAEQCENGRVYDGPAQCSKKGAGAEGGLPRAARTE